MTGNAQLITLLAEQIAQSGPISFAHFMGQALYHPALGYYASGRARIGREGDFFTNVSVGPLFGRLMAFQFLEIWEQLGRPDPFTVVEQGANNGDFAADVLSALEPTPLFPSLCYRIVEPVAGLRQEQARKLEPFPCVHWSENLHNLPPFCGVHFSNELLDALPVHLLRRTGGVWKERLVDLQHGEFCFVDSREESPAGAGLPVQAEGYQTEVNLEAPAWIDQVASKITRGFILAIDYGFPREEFFSPERSSGTLTGYRNHQRCANPLADVGETDLTAHVEFTSLIQRASTQGMTLCGFTDQHRFMVGLAKPHLEQMATDPKALRAFRTLMHPAFMGSAFKVLALQKGLTATLRAFPENEYLEIRP